MLTESDRLFHGECVKCLICDEVNCHPVSVKVIKEKHTIEVKWHGIAIEDAPAFGRRGVIVCIEFWCEHGGHQFSLNYAFHKGSTYISTTPLETGDRPCIWRD